MESYEVTTVLAGGATAAKRKSAKSQMEKAVIAQEGKVVGFEDWGEHELAYTIDGNNAGVFLIYQVELGGGKVRELDNVLRLDEGIVRHLIVKNGKKSQ